MADAFLTKFKAFKHNISAIPDWDYLSQRADYFLNLNSKNLNFYSLKYRFQPKSVDFKNDKNDYFSLSYDRKRKLRAQLSNLSWNQILS